MEDLYAKFLPQFITLARSRIALAITTAKQGDPAGTKTLVRELHTLAGEAGLLGLSSVVPLARACELKAVALNSSRTDAEVEVLLTALRELGTVIESIGAASSSKGGGP